MDFVTPMYGALQAQANLAQTQAVTQDTQALAQQRMQQVQLMGLNLQRQNNTMTALSNYLSGQTSDPSLEPSPNDTPMQASQKNVARMQQDANFARGAAKAVAQAGGDFNTIQKLMSDATQAAHWSAYAARESLQERGKQADYIASAAGSAVPGNDQSNQIAYQKLVGLDPVLAQNLSFDRDPNGNVISGPVTDSTFKTIAAAGIQAAKQASLAVQVGDAERKKQDAATRAAAETRKEQESDSLIAQRTAGANLATAKTAAVTAGPSAKPLTIPQQRINEQIDEARTEAAGFAPAEISKFYDNFAAESLRNPKMLNVLQMAATRKYGDDPDYADVRGRLSPAAHIAGKAAPVATAQPKAAAAPAPSTGGIQDGATATNPDTGAKLIRKNGQWVPL